MANSSATVGPNASRTAARALDGVGVVAALQIGGGDQKHRQVHRARDEHRHADIPSVARNSLARAGPASGWPWRSRASPECRYTACGITVAPSMAVVSRTLRRRRSGGEGPPRPVRVGSLDEEAGQESDRDDQQQAADHEFEVALPVAVLHGQQHE